MVKYIILAIILNTTLLVDKLINQDVYLEIRAPEIAEAGSTVEVEVELHKARMTGFARFQQELPYGVTATPVYPADVNFSFEDNMLKMIWLSLPEEEIITVRYQIHINERLKGDLQLDGTFSYIDNNQRMITSAPGSFLAINPSPDIEDRYLVDVNESNLKLLSPAPAVLPQNIIALRQEPVPDTDNSFVVNILVNKEDENYFAKIEETIPVGYTAEEIDSKGGIFSFSDQNARIIWRNLPIESNFIVSYRLVPESDSEGNPEVSGEFSFMHNGITANRRIPQRNHDLVAMTDEQKNELVASVPGESIRPLPVPAERPGASVAVRAGTQLKNPLDPEPGIYYRIQLAAGHRPVEIDNYFSRLKITDDVRSEIHEGWIKYSIGSYYNYMAARDYRVHIWNTTPVTDAFVAAYNEGSRITVQEALMISNHQWYR